MNANTLAHEAFGDGLRARNPIVSAANGAIRNGLAAARSATGKIGEDGAPRARRVRVSVVLLMLHFPFIEVLLRTGAPMRLEEPVD
jgi:hypothetical protein